MNKQAEYQAEFDKWTGLFSVTDETTQKAASGLIQKAARIHAVCCELEDAIDASGAIKVHPDHPDLQKQVPAVKEYARQTEAYSALVKALNKMLGANQPEEEDGLGDYDDED